MEHEGGSSSIPKAILASEKLVSLRCVHAFIHETK